MKIEELQKRAAQVRLDTLKAIYKAGTGYIGLNMSMIEILVALYHGDLGMQKVMNYNTEKPGCAEQDYLILSKSSAAPALYSILAEAGFFDKSELEYLGQIGSFLKEKPNSKVPGVALSVLKDGHGLSMALGLALCLKMERVKNRVYTILDHLELQKGQVWEAANLAAHYNLDNLIAIVDHPKVEVATEKLGEIRLDQIQDKFEAFGWKVIQVRDAHDFNQLLDGFEKSFASVRKPVCIWCHTVAGKGIEFAERKHSYLKATLSHGEMTAVVSKLEKSV